MAINSIFGYSRHELKDFVTQMGLKSFVATQLMEWVYHKNKTDFSEMTSLSKQNKERLAEVLSVSLFTDSQSVPSSDALATKLICTLGDGKKVECVVLKEKNYYTLCVSSQVGCPVDCKFCVTGVAGFKRNLTPAEIVMQIVYARKMGYMIKNLVFMGMGEPLLNYDNVFKAIDILTAEWGYNMSKRNITVSTSGFLANINRLIDDQRYINLAFSVGSADPQTRLKIMPLEKRNPILQVARKLNQYLKLHNRQLTLEYTLLNNVNDTDYDINALVNLSKYLNAKINLINLNPHHKIPFEPVTSKKMAKIKNKIKQARAKVTVRFKKGQDIAAACGQLGESIMK